MKRNLSAEQLLPTLSNSRIRAVITQLMPAHRNRLQVSWDAELNIRK